ncbi:hypothetical protein Trydic_g13990 [Trypoxylus dichotomus]
MDVEIKTQPNTVSKNPRRTKKQQKWIGFGRCAIHFSPETKVSDMYLKKDAVPSLYHPGHTDSESLSKGGHRRNILVSSELSTKIEEQTEHVPNKIHDLFSNNRLLERKRANTF